jgi:hypothetical protein
MSDGPIKYCPNCQTEMTLTVKEDRNPPKQWECFECGEVCPTYGREQEGET